MQWIQDPSQSNVVNLNNVRPEASRHFRKKKKVYVKAKFQELESSSKIKNIRDLYRASMTLRRITSLELIFTQSTALAKLWRHILSALVDLMQ